MDIGLVIIFFRLRPWITTCFRLNSTSYQNKHIGFFILLVLLYFFLRAAVDMSNPCFDWFSSNTISAHILRGEKLSRASVERIQHYPSLLNTTLLNNVERVKERKSTSRYNITQHCWTRLATLFNDVHCCWIMFPASAQMCLALLHMAAKQIQRCFSHLVTKEMFNVVGVNVWWQSNFIPHHLTGWPMAFTCEYNNAERCWVEMMDSFVRGVRKTKNK